MSQGNAILVNSLGAKTVNVNAGAVLNSLASAGLVTRHIFRDGKARYERTGGAPHPHLIDVETGEIAELEDNGDLARLIEEEARRIGFCLVEFKLKLFGERRPA